VKRLVIVTAVLVVGTGLIATAMPRADVEDWLVAIGCGAAATLFFLLVVAPRWTERAGLIPSSNSRRSRWITAATVVAVVFGSALAESVGRGTLGGALVGTAVGFFLGLSVWTPKFAG
jgi:hypothetical protein